MRIDLPLSHDALNKGFISLHNLVACWHVYVLLVAAFVSVPPRNAIPGNVVPAGHIKYDDKADIFLVFTRSNGVSCVFSTTTSLPSEKPLLVCSSNSCCVPSVNAKRSQINARDSISKRLLGLLPVVFGIDVLPECLLVHPETSILIQSNGPWAWNQLGRNVGTM